MNAPPPTPADAVPAFDAPTLARLRAELDPDGSLGLLPRLMRAFESLLLRLMVEAAEARDRGDVVALGRIAHTLKSSSNSLGALSLGACCAEIERAVRAGETVDVVQQVARLLAECALTLDGVRAMLQA